MSRIWSYEPLYEAQVKTSELFLEETLIELSESLNSLIAFDDILESSMSDILFEETNDVKVAIMQKVTNGIGRTFKGFSGYMNAQLKKFEALKMAFDKHEKVANKMIESKSKTLDMKRTLHDFVHISVPDKSLIGKMLAKIPNYNKIGLIALGENAGKEIKNRFGKMSSNNRLGIAEYIYGILGMKYEAEQAIDSTSLSRAFFVEKRFITRSQMLSFREECVGITKDIINTVINEYINTQKAFDENSRKWSEKPVDEKNKDYFMYLQAVANNIKEYYSVLTLMYVGVIKTSASSIEKLGKMAVTRYIVGDNAA